MEIHEQITFSPLNLASIGNAKSLTLTRNTGNTKSTNNKLGAFFSAFNRFKSSSRVETNENKKANSISKAYFILNENQQKNFDSLQKLIE